MKKFSSPPMIIVLDVLFVVLFILVMEQSPDIKIKLPKDVWLKDTVIASIDKNQRVKHWFNLKTDKWESIKDFKVSNVNKKFNFMIGNIECTTNKYCKKIPSIEGETKKIYLTGDLYDEISGMITDSCLQFPKQCSNVTYIIQDDGTINRDKLKQDYQIFRYILK